jgi:hypothetical protein
MVHQFSCISQAYIGDSTLLPPYSTEFLIPPPSSHCSKSLIPPPLLPFHCTKFPLSIVQDSSILILFPPYRIPPSSSPSHCTDSLLPLPLTFLLPLNYSFSPSHCTEFLPPPHLPTVQTLLPLPLTFLLPLNYSFSLPSFLCTEFHLPPPLPTVQNSFILLTFPLYRFSPASPSYLTPSSSKYPCCTELILPLLPTVQNNSSFLILFPLYRIHPSSSPSHCT